MNIKILGCGTSTGVPIPGCRCRVCTSRDPRNSRDRTSALIRTDSLKSILIDTTPDLRYQAIKWEIEALDAVLYTHAHADHIFGIDDLRGFNFQSGKRIPCYGTESTLREIRRRFDYIFHTNEGYQGGALAKLDLIEIKTGVPFQIAECRIEPFTVHHGAMEVTGYKLGSFAYATDCNSIPVESLDLLRGIKILVLDGLRQSPHSTHFSIAQAIEVAKQLGAHTTFLTHMCHSVDYEKVSLELPKGIHLAYDGMEIELSEQ